MVAGLDEIAKMAWAASDARRTVGAVPSGGDERATRSDSLTDGRGSPYAPGEGPGSSDGHSLEDARRAVADTEAGRQLRDLASGKHRHEKAQEWQASVFWDRAEERLMHHFGSEALSRFAVERHYSWLESYRVNKT